jgi:hypothetical protein
MMGGAPAVLAALEGGYQAGADTIERLALALAVKLPAAVGIGRRLVRGMEGDELDIHAVNRGDIGRAWSSRKRLVKTGKSAVRLCVDIGGNAGADADALRWRGIAALVMSQLLHKAQYKTEIIACFAVKGGIEYRREERLTISCIVKPFAARADLPLLAASVALTGFFRTLGFAAICKAADDAGGTVDDGLGQYLDITGALPVADNVTQLIVPQSINNENEALDWINQTVSLLQSLKRGE